MTTEQEVKAAVRLLAPFDREMYFYFLPVAKIELGLPEDERSLRAAVLALAKTKRNRQVRREKRWPYTDNT